VCSVYFDDVVFVVVVVVVVVVIILLDVGWVIIPMVPERDVLV